MQIMRRIKTIRWEFILPILGFLILYPAGLMLGIQIGRSVYKSDNRLIVLQEQILAELHEQNLALSDLINPEIERHD
jgi:hypothetical protein